MTVQNQPEISKKRKKSEEETFPPSDLQPNGVLEMLSDEEDDADAYSDDGHIDEFPEIVADSDSDRSDEDEDADEEEDQEEDEEQSDEEDGSQSDRSLHVFPKAKTIVSKITNQPKLVYPEIEPDYDSDSSTEEVNG